MLPKMQNDMQRMDIKLDQEEKSSNVLHSINQSM